MEAIKVTSSHKPPSDGGMAKEEFIRVGTTLYKIVEQPRLNGGYVKKRIPWNNEINTAHRWYPDFANLFRLERLAKQIGLSAMEFAELFKGRIVNFTGRLFSSEHNRWFATDNTPLQILRDNDKRLTLTANRIPLSQWFNEQYDKLRQSIRQPIQPKKSRGMKL